MTTHWEDYGETDETRIILMSDRGDSVREIAEATGEKIARIQEIIAAAPKPAKRHAEGYTMRRCERCGGRELVEKPHKHGYR